MNAPMMKPEYALSFAAWELRLYLDTHPNDEKALAAYKQLCAAQANTCNYACSTCQGRGQQHGAPTPAGGCMPQKANPCGDKVWTWVNGPWPWEYEANVHGGKC